MKGQSGNPAGRPRGRYREAPYETVLGQMVTTREGGTERRVTAAEAFLLQLAKRGVEGDSAAARASLGVIEEARKQPSAGGPLNIVRTVVAPGSVTFALEALRMAKKLDSYRETARIRARAELHLANDCCQLGRLTRRRFTHSEEVQTASLRSESSRDEPVATQKDYRKRYRVNKSRIADWS
jgi:Family of unknown function (DUF5681)